MNQFETAQDIAALLPEEGYKHSLEVASKLTGDAKTVGLLHDTVEDNAWSLEELRQEFEPHIVEAVDAITRRKGEQYFDYIQRLSKNALAKEVKIADLNVNLARPGKESLKPRYMKALNILRG